MPKLQRHISFLLGLILLNCSIDAPDASLFGADENLSVNKQESIVELVVEKIFGYDEAIAEYDESDCQNEISFKKNLATDFFILPITAVFVPRESPQASFVRIYVAPSFAHPDAGILSPPPEFKA